MGQLQAIIVPVTPFQQNCTILFDGETKKGVVIDPGGDLARIREAIESQGIDVEAIWITHGHIDHAAAALDLKEALGVDIIGPHRDDKFLLDNLVAAGLKYGITEGVRNVTPDQWLEEGEKVCVAGHVFDVFHCPGHAPGHVVFFNPEARFAIVGDVLFNGSVGRTDLPGGDHATLIRSIKEKLLPLGDDIGFICGHGPGGQFGEERRSNPFLTDTGYA
ncbi:MBL fold metallo-hydrolase [Brucella sp. 191011898]|uniref:MBL fold metallo-hydrolase n=1 Tax=Brucella sp. 191011898 TaxID=2730447 RepID=UPI0015DF5171|nr:MBL fold metallo-hydrolase [Brucella sp. 191011898]CAB4327751.1 beta-lactamase domain-containing protein [Brucella sp. 191011898]